MYIVAQTMADTVNNNILITRLHYASTKYSVILQKS